MDDITRIQRYFAQKARNRNCSGVESTVKTDGKPCAVSIACTVWEAAWGKHR